MAKSLLIPSNLSNTGSKLTKLRDEYQSLTSKEKIESYLAKKLREDDYYNDNDLMADMMNNQKNLAAINEYLATVSKLKENKDNV